MKYLLIFFISTMAFAAEETAAEKFMRLMCHLDTTRMAPAALVKYNAWKATHCQEE